MGGTMVGMMGRIMGRVIATDTDPRGMGRLAHVYITGKDNRKIISSAVTEQQKRKMEKSQHMHSK
eukprot:11901969-Ditylum_brightwellii.AAC.1